MSLSIASVALSAGLALASAVPALAQTVSQDRYGPPPASAFGGPAGPNAHSGPMLSWAGKRGGSTTSAPAAYARPEPMALARQFIPQLALQSAPQAAPIAPFGPTAPSPAAVMAPIPPQVQPQGAAQGPLPPQALAAAPLPAPDLLGGPPQGPLPTSIYGTTAPQPQAPVQQWAQAPQMTSPASPPQAAPAPAPTPGVRSGGAHLYSLHRAYGMTPDAIPPPPIGDNYILVGPSSSPNEPDDAEDPAQGLDRQF
ncbi:MAG: hypothetical protein MH112_05420 [Phenylobacterium sp.]|uniref:hypothetical protein n=1 Tax=Phenylobacterium sp. TaxID=1871053 RepID=UPI0025E13C81|nr:hypothetical protein [Phenylobacterium sp.]MCG9915785.1 hypothetical protein [Phenylobacterium sp.]